MPIRCAKVVLIAVGCVSTLSQAILGEPLSSRYEKLACAVVQVTSDNEIGTAFFIDDHSTLATVAHVLYNKNFRRVGNSVVADLKKKPNLAIRLSDGELIPLNVPEADDEDRRKALIDLAMVRTSITNKCFIPLGDSDKVKVGQHLIAIGFPASASSEVLYDGFLSARSARLRLPMGPIENAPQLVYAPDYEVFRVQMPITPGSSGSPIIADSDTVVGVVSEAPIIMAKDVQELAALFGTNDRSSSGVLLSGFDTTKILGELAWTVQEFESPGAGLAVPTSNMKRPDFVRSTFFQRPAEQSAHWR